MASGVHPRSGRTPPAVEVVARELERQVRAAVARGDWLSARPQPAEPAQSAQPAETATAETG
ncbi:hypothetical protein [Streptomyces cuspidosporus]|uniref:Uncharacterized protein n=1 Tax=Streptomyces cuspidosporus TaxID=66882 RepID=A0ABP5T015_9ACTN